MVMSKGQNFVVTQTLSFVGAASCVFLCVAGNKLFR